MTASAESPPRPSSSASTSPRRRGTCICCRSEKSLKLAADEAGLAKLRAELAPLAALLGRHGGQRRVRAANSPRSWSPRDTASPSSIRGRSATSPAASASWPRPIRIDARVLAQFADAVQPRPLEKLPAKQAELDDLVTRRRQLIELRTMEKNRLGQASSQGRRGRASFASWTPFASSSATSIG